MVAVMSRAPLARLRELVARHPQFSVALAVGAVLRLVAMLGYPGTLWFAGDSYVYVGAALRPTPDQSKTTGYSLFLRALLPFHSFTLVTGLQHLMGLGIAVMVYLLARRAGVSKVWATAATLPVLLDGFEIEDEHMVMAEALFTFLIMLAMLLILWRSRTSWVTALIAGLLEWSGFVPNDQAMRKVDGALAGLSLLQDEANFRHSMPTKVVEYMARGVPVVTTPLPAAADLVTRYECGFVVPFGDPRAAAEAVLKLAGDASLRAKMGSRGHEAALTCMGWPADARAFVAQLEAWARTP